MAEKEFHYGDRQECMDCPMMDSPCCKICEKANEPLSFPNFKKEEN